MSNADDLKAMDAWVKNHRPPDGAPAAVIATWNYHRSSWDPWYARVIDSWYVSDADLASGRAKRAAMQRAIDPAGWKKIVADKAAAEGLASKKTAKPIKSLTRSKAEVKQLQATLNAMGWTPKLKVDGNYGPKTAAAERALMGSQTQQTPLQMAAPGVAAAARAAVEQLKAESGKPAPTAKAVEKVAASQAEINAGVTPADKVRARVEQIKARLSKGGTIGALGGAALGFKFGGPVGAGIGAVAGYFGGREAEGLL